MDRQVAITVAVLSVVLVGLSSVASKKFGEPDEAGAVAAAIEAEFADWVGMESIARGATALPRFILCLDSARRLDVAAVAGHLSHTIITAVPASQCTSKTVEGDFGMFTALTTYYDGSREEAAHLEIADIRCATTSICTVDIDSHGSGMRYEMKREGSAWHVSERRMRWIV